MKTNSKKELANIMDREMATKDPKNMKTKKTIKNRKVEPFCISVPSGISFKDRSAVNQHLIRMPDFSKRGKIICRHLLHTKS